MLTDSQIKAAKPKAKPFKLYDGGGLFLLVMPSGSKLWRFRYAKPGQRTGSGRAREGGKALGKYPLIRLAEARRRRDELAVQLAHGIDPAEAEKAEQRAAEGSLRNVVRAYYRLPGQPGSAVADERRIERLLFDQLGDRHVDDITAKELLDVFVAAIEAHGIVESVRRTRASLARIYRQAIIEGHTTHNPADALVGCAALKKPPMARMPHVVEPVRVGQLLRLIWAYEGPETVRLALRFLPYVFVRSGELRGAMWSEIDLDAALWTIPAERMKMRRDHTVPLSRQALQILDQAKQLWSPSGYVFPGIREPERPMHENVLNTGLREAGIDTREHSCHGFRHMASTLLEGELRYETRLVERQMAHQIQDAVRRRYNVALYTEARAQMMQSYADFLDGLRDGANVVPIGALSC